MYTGHANDTMHSYHKMRMREGSITAYIFSFFFFKWIQFFFNYFEEN